LNKRGLNKALLFVTDGLTGIEETIFQTYPFADIQRCLVHISRNIFSKVRVNDRTQVLTDFKLIYRAKDKSGAIIQLNSFHTKWDKIYPKVIQLVENNQYILTFFDYPEEIRSSIYSTNLIENFNKHLKRKTKTKTQFPSEESMEKYLVSMFDEYNLNNGSRIHKGFGLVLSELNQMMENKYKTLKP